jgi:hypothetical protein
MQPAREAEQRGLVGSIQKEVSNESNIIPPVSELKAECKALNIERRAYNRAGLAPGAAAQRIEEIDRSLSAGADEKTLAAAAMEVARLKSITPTMQMCASQNVACKLLAMVEKANKILDLVDAHLAAYLANAEAAETAFFAGHGLPRPTQGTAVVHRVQAAIARAKIARESLTPHPMLPSPGFNVWVFDPVSVLSGLVC